MNEKLLVAFISAVGAIVIARVSCYAQYQKKRKQQTIVSLTIHETKNTKG